MCELDINTLSTTWFLQSFTTILLQSPSPGESRTVLPPFLATIFQKWASLKRVSSYYIRTPLLSKIYHVGNTSTTSPSCLTLLPKPRRPQGVPRILRDQSPKGGPRQERKIHCCTLWRFPS